ncbi:hypothetical protein HU200_005707 [Digitaria exilis]|uniref:Uncharacterized protein n=1 Tax=Digitaria exilis TaxID=1010633 RepID=A0A835KU07_9POAL|nr:hypothetical protein HU200_005707 [Digitaria exilis]
MDYHPWSRRVPEAQLIQLAGLSSAKHDDRQEKMGVLMISAHCPFYRLRQREEDIPTTFSPNAPRNHRLRCTAHRVVVASCYCCRAGLRSIDPVHIGADAGLAQSLCARVHKKVLLLHPYRADRKKSGRDHMRSPGAPRKRNTQLYLTRHRPHRARFDPPRVVLTVTHAGQRARRAPAARRSAPRAHRTTRCYAFLAVYPANRGEKVASPMIGRTETIAGRKIRREPFGSEQQTGRVRRGREVAGQEADSPADVDHRIGEASRAPASEGRHERPYSASGVKNSNRDDVGNPAAVDEMHRTGRWRLAVVVVRVLAEAEAGCGGRETWSRPGRGEGRACDLVDGHARRTGSASGIGATGPPVEPDADARSDGAGGALDTRPSAPRSPTLGSLPSPRPKRCRLALASCLAAGAATYNNLQWRS